MNVQIRNRVNSYPDGGINPLSVILQINLSGTGSCYEVTKMPARDNFHSAVKNALIREDWEKEIESWTN